MSNEQKFLALTRELLTTIKKSKMLEAYWGLWQTKVSQGTDPEDCPYVRLAARRFFDDGEAASLREMINKFQALNSEEKQ